MHNHSTLQKPFANCLKPPARPIAQFGLKQNPSIIKKTELMQTNTNPVYSALISNNYLFFHFNH